MTFIGMMLSMKVQAADMPANPVDKPGYTLDYSQKGKEFYLKGICLKKQTLNG